MLRLNQKVYVLILNYKYNASIIIKEPMCLISGKVYMKNNSAFIIHQALNSDYIEEVRKEQRFYDENITWFRTLKAAKEYLKQLGYKYQKKDNDYWEVWKEEL